jgi:hypothetical protein
MIPNVDVFNLSINQANTLASLPIRSIQREYPNALLHVLNGPEDIRSPRELHPAFFGCFDWHSAVHGHWMLIRLLKLFPMAEEALIRQMIGENLTAKNIKEETRYFESRPSFERPYGWAWLLKLCQELHGWGDAEGKQWRANVRPLEELLVRRYQEFLPNQTYPIRVGTHGNTAFGLSFALDYAVATGNSSFEAHLKRRSRDYYQADVRSGVWLEPSGNDFFSPSLIEADLMRRVLTGPEFAEWFKAFLPDASSILSPAKVSDRSDPQIGHLDGLNLSRAWCLRSIGRQLGDDCLLSAAETHAREGLAHVASGHYEGEHWLGSFAVYLLTS